MAFRRSDLQEAFFVPGTQPFRVYGYGTSDPLEEVLAPGYFKHARGLLRPGELIYVSACPGAPRGGGADHGATPSRSRSRVRLIRSLLEMAMTTPRPGLIEIGARPRDQAGPQV